MNSYRSLLQMLIMWNCYRKAPLKVVLRPIRNKIRGRP